MFVFFGIVTSSYFLCFHTKLSNNKLLYVSNDFFTFFCQFYQLSLFTWISKTSKPVQKDCYTFRYILLLITASLRVFISENICSHFSFWKINKSTEIWSCVCTNPCYYQFAAGFFQFQSIHKALATTLLSNTTWL